MNNNSDNNNNKDNTNHDDEDMDNDEHANRQQTGGAANRMVPQCGRGGWWRGG